ncbi:MAG: glycosyltransferase [Hyphomicrobiales bacterium]
MSALAPIRDAASAPAVTYVWTFAHDDRDLVDLLGGYIETIGRIDLAKELIVVDDGVGGPVREAMIARLKGAGFPTALYSLHRAGGESAAMYSGLHHASGDAIVMLPAYRQVDDAEIAGITDAILEGSLDYIASWRHPRVDSWFGRLLSNGFNGVTARLTGIELHDLNSGLRAMRRRVVAEVPLHGDLYRFLPVLAAFQGFRVGERPVKHVAELVRRGDYRPGIFVRRFLDLLSLFFISKFTRKPLRFFGLAGTLMFALGSATLAYLVVQRVLGRSLADRPLLVLAVLILVLGAQLFSIGLLGELIIFTYAGDVPEYKIEAVYDSTNADGS